MYAVKQEKEFQKTKQQKGLIMKRNFFKIFTAAVILAVSVTGCGPSKKDIAEKKLLEEKIADLESKLQKVSIIENSKTAIEEFVKKDAPPGGTVKCLSVVLNDPCGLLFSRRICSLSFDFGDSSNRLKEAFQVFIPSNMRNFPEFTAITAIFSVKKLARTPFREYLIG